VGRSKEKKEERKKLAGKWKSGASETEGSEGQRKELEGSANMEPAFNKKQGGGVAGKSYEGRRLGEENGGNRDKRKKVQKYRRGGKRGGGEKFAQRVCKQKNPRQRGKSRKNKLIFWHNRN